MYTVYILRDRTGKVYKGSTNNLERRLQEHLRGHTQTTSRMMGITLIYKECFNSVIQARQRERYFKTAAGRRWLKQQNII